MRREYVYVSVITGEGAGSPLHAQGIPHSMLIISQPTRITPACAGNTESYTLCNVPIEDHPCMRREYFTFMVEKLQALGSPLHAQGILGILILPLLGRRITPACAGNTITRNKEKRFI